MLFLITRLVDKYPAHENVVGMMGEIGLGPSSCLRRFLCHPTQQISRMGCGTWNWGNQLLWDYNLEADTDLEEVENTCYCIVSYHQIHDENPFLDDTSPYVYLGITVRNYPCLGKLQDAQTRYRKLLSALTLHTCFSEELSDIRLEFAT